MIMNAHPQTIQHAESVARRTLNQRDYERFLPLVRRVAMRFARKVPSHITVADLVGYGWVGLMEAYQRSAPGMNHDEFDAYALYRIRGAMLDHLRSLDPASRDVRATSRKVAAAIRTLTQDLGRPPDEEEIARAVEMTVEQYRSALSRIDQAGMARLEMLDFDSTEPRSSDEPVDDEVARKEMRGAVTDAIGSLPERLQQVLALYYQEDCTLREIGAVLGVSESRVSQLHTEAVHRLRAAIGKE